MWERHQDPDARLCSQRRQIGGYKILRGGETCKKCLLSHISLLLFGQFSFYCLSLTHSFLLNELMTSLTTIHCRALPVLLGPQQHEIFTCRDCCRCFRPSVLFIHKGPPLPVIVAGGLRLSRPHSYLTLGPLHLLAHSQKHIVSAWLSQQPSTFQLCWPDAAQRSLSAAQNKGFWEL